MHTVFSVRTLGPGLHEFPDQAVRFVRDSGLQEGLLTLCVQENADPDMRRDLGAFFRRLVPSSDDPSMQWLTHTIEGADDMPAHIKAALDGRPALGTWQGIYLFEHRDRGPTRRVVRQFVA